MRWLTWALGRRLLQVKVTWGGRPVESRTVGAGSEVLPDLPLGLNVQPTARGFQLSTQEGTIELREGEGASLERGRLGIEVGVIRRRFFPRLSFEQSDLVLPVIVLAVSLLIAQLQLFSSLFASDSAGPAAPEPSPEFIARLLQERYDGADQGVIAPTEARPSGDKIDAYYLPSGHAGPIEKARGGKNLGRRVQQGELEEQSMAPTAPPVVEQGTELLSEEAEEAPEVDPDTTGEDPKTEEIAEHITEGWGFTDWYDTEDARSDAQEIKKNLELSRQLLRIDPNDPYALSLRAYYEYLAMDFKSARRTYEKVTKLYPEDASGWNNLALTYKRTGDYKKEEELYRIALGLSPDDSHALLNLAVCLAHQERFEEALAIMQKLERIIPNDPYADLHRAKIFAAKGEKEKAYRFLQKSLSAMRKLDTLHNIEFRQDIRVDPAFEEIRSEERFSKLLDRYYGDDPGGWWKRRRP
jgi:tetratricopeptide (TPR) repeat protein